MINAYHTNAWDYISKLPDQSVDAMITDPLYDDTMDMDEIHRVCRGNVIMFCEAGKPFFKWDELAYWVKTPSTKNYSRHLGRFVEWITIERRGNNVFNGNLHWSNYTGVYDDRLLEKKVHEFQKPLSLMERLIAIYTNPGDFVLDPFMGSGSTLIAAYRLGRRAVGCELEQKYIEQFKRDAPFKISKDANLWI